MLCRVYTSFSHYVEVHTFFRRAEFETLDGTLFFLISFYLALKRIRSFGEAKESLTLIAPRTEFLSLVAQTVHIFSVKRVFVFFYVCIPGDFYGGIFVSLDSHFSFGFLRSLFKTSFSTDDIFLTINLASLAAYLINSKERPSVMMLSKRVC